MSHRLDAKDARQDVMNEAHDHPVHDARFAAMRYAKQKSRSMALRGAGRDSDFAGRN